MKSEFFMASEQAFQSISFIEAAILHAAKGDVVRAKRCLEKGLPLMRTAQPTLLDNKHELTARIQGDVKTKWSDGTVKHHHSAHEAFGWMWYKIDRALRKADWVVPKNLAEWLGLDTSILQFQMELERSLLAVDGTPASKSPPVALFDEQAKPAENLPPVVASTTPPTVKKSGKAATVAERMASDFLKDPTVMAAMSASKLQQKYDCSKTTVMDTETWKNIMTHRKIEKANRIDRDVRPDQRTDRRRR